MIDLHSHILPGIDDGAATIEDARALAHSVLADGTTTIAATPHVRADHPTTPERMEAGVATLRADFAERGIALDVLHGGEVDLDELARMSPDDVRRFTLGQTGRYLLVEFPFVGWSLSLEPRLFELVLTGVAPLLAHPERNRAVQADPERLRPLVEAGAYVQITAASLNGRFGRESSRSARELARHGLAHVLASDTHGLSVRAPSLAEAREAIGDAALGAYLTETAPAAIVAGEPLPAPPTPRRRGLLRRS